MTMTPFVDSKPRYETFSLSCDLKTTNDLEAATKTITATAEASGTGNADYSAAITQPAPTDTRLVIARVATRLSVTIDSDDGTHDLRCRVYVDAQDADHMLYDLTYSTTGNQLAVQDALVGTKEVIFNLLKDGSAHTFYFFLWSPGNHSPVVSVAQLWTGYGSTTQTSWWGNNSCIRLYVTGLVTASCYWKAAGSGTGTIVYLRDGTSGQNLIHTTSRGAGISEGSTTPNIMAPIASIHYTSLVSGSVATDIVAVYGYSATVRSDS